MIRILSVNASNYTLDHEFSSGVLQHSVFAQSSRTARYGHSTCVGRMGSSYQLTVQGGCHG